MLGVEVVIIGILVAIGFGVFRRKQKTNSSGKTRIVVDHDSDNIEISTDSDGSNSKPSTFKKLLVLVVSAGAGFAVSGVIIVTAVEPAIGAVDPGSPLAIGMYLILTLVIYAIIRGFSRR